MKRGFSEVDSEGQPLHHTRNVDVSLAGPTAMGTLIHPTMMPWELTGAMRQIFGGPPAPWIKPLAVPRNMPFVDSPTSPRLTDLSKATTLIQETCHRATYGTNRDHNRDWVLLKWAELVLLEPQQSTLGLQLLADVHKDGKADRSFTIVSDALRGKATSTLKTRLSSLALYVRWAKSMYLDVDLLPFEEASVYEYLCSLRGASCSATRGSTFLSTLGFVGEVIGMYGTKECLESSRVKGAALDMFLEKRPLKQAPALPAIMIATLELAAFCERDGYLRALAGYCLCCAYGRMRVSDLNRLVHASKLGAYVEGSLMRVKTSRTKEKQCTFLPVIIPCSGLLGVAWFEAFSTTRLMLELDEIPSLASASADRSFVMLPSEDTIHLDNSTKVSSTEITDGLLKKLGKVFSSDELKFVTSHSLKATFLTYFNMIGGDRTESELLGYHITSHGSALNYQRDTLATPIRNFAEMLARLQKGLFRPDRERDDSTRTQCCGCDHATASWYRKNARGACQDLHEGLSGKCVGRRVKWIVKEPIGFSDAAPPQFAGKHEEAGETDQSECSDSNSSSAESAQAEVERVLQSRERLKLIAIKANVDAMYRHRRTTVRPCTFCMWMTPQKTACGREMGPNYDKFIGDPDKAWPHCKNCRGNLNP